MDDITRVGIMIGDYERAFVQRAGSWFFDDQDGPPVSTDRWAGVTLLLSGPQAKRLITQEVTDLTAYGLDPPRATIDIDLLGARGLTLSLGDRTPDGSSHYARNERDTGLYLVDANWGDVLYRLNAEPPYPEWYYRIPSERIIFLAISHGGDEVSFTKDEVRGLWRFAMAEPPPLDEQRWAEVLPLLGGPPSLRVLADYIDDPSEYGLSDHQAVTAIRVEFRAPPTMSQILRMNLEMHIGASLPDGSGYYARALGSPYLLFVDASWVETLTRLVVSPPEAE
jgi:hypothetical protein